jgi:hypothetical protein
MMPGPPRASPPYQGFSTKLSQLGLSGSLLYRGWGRRLPEVMERTQGHIACLIPSPRPQLEPLSSME